MKRLLRLLCMVFALVLIAGTFSACVNSTDNSGDKTSSNVSYGGETSYSYGPVDYGEFPYADTKYDDDTGTIRILCVERARHKYGEQQFVYISENEGNVINSAVQERNNYLSEQYGINLEITAVQSPAQDIVVLIQSNTDEYDVICDSVDRLVTGVSENYYWSLDTVMNLSHPWWDQQAIETLSLADKHYFLAGAAILTDDDNTYLTLYNKNMYESNAGLSSKFGDIYTLVRDGKFTIDVYYEMCKAVSHTDSNGEWGFNATYGNLSHAYGATVMVNGCGVATVAKNENDELYLNVMSEYSVNAFSKVYELMSDQQNTQRAELIIGKSPNTTSTYGFSELQEMFTSGRGLFYNTTASSVSTLKSMSIDFEFGVLPIPKYSEEQDNYCCTVNRYHSSALAIPTSVPTSRLPVIGFALQAMGFYNTDVIRAYYQTTLQLQAVYTDDDADMLDIVYNNRFYDIGAIFGWGDTGSSNNLINLYGSFISDATSNTLVSRWESMESMVQTAMDSAIDAYKNSIT